MRKRWMKFAACVVVGFAFMNAVVPTSHAEGSTGVKTSYAMPTISNKNNVPLATPRWSVDLGGSAMDVIFNTPKIVTANGNALFVKSGKLQAINVTSGKSSWTFGKYLQLNTITTAGSYVYVADYDGAVYRVDAKSGKGAKLYQFANAKGKATRMDQLSASEAEGVLYVLDTTTLAAVDLTSGKQLWRNDSFYIPQVPKLVNGKLLMHVSESGAITVGTTYALDPKTGKTLWRLAGDHSELLGVDGDHLYFQDYWPNIDDTSIAKLDVVSLSTGEVTASRAYPSPNTSTVVQRASQLVIDGNDLYIGLGGSGVYRYGLQADPLVAKPAYFSANGTWIAGPYNGKLFFTTSDHIGMFSIKLLNHNLDPYSVVDNPISRLDLIDSGMFIGQSDGSILVFNVKTGQTQFRYETSARNYGPFQTVGNTLLVQAENKLYAFALSSELTKPVTDADSIAVGYTKAQAKLSVNGEIREFNPSMMSAANRMFVPLRFLTETLGAKVAYDSKTKSSTVTYEGRVFTIAEGKAYATIEGNQ